MIHQHLIFVLAPTPKFHLVTWWMNGWSRR